MKYKTNSAIMKTTNSVAKLLLPGFLFASLFGCDNESVPAGPKPDGAALIEWYNSSTEDNVQHLSIIASAGGTLTGTKGTKLQFGPNAFTTQSGDAVNGTVDIELIEIYDRGSMLLTKRGTNGKTNDGKISTLISGGEFFVNATQNEVDLKLKSGFTIIAPTDNTGGINEGMQLFDGVVECEGDNCNLVWEAVDRGIQVGEFQGTGGWKTAYYAFQSKFGWTNIDKWYSDPRPKTTIFVDVPEGFDNTNCTVFLAYEGETTVLASFDKYDQDKKMFTEHYGLIPIGLEVHFIFVSMIEDEVQYAIQSATIAENHVESIGAVKSITTEELVELVNKLP
jgi:hypothetical protein